MLCSVFQGAVLRPHISAKAETKNNKAKQICFPTDGG